jgi:hypothetical protein
LRKSHLVPAKVRSLREFKARFRAGTTVDSVTYKIAETQAEREAAFRLVYNAYVASGLIPRNVYGMRVTPYQLQPTTTVFVARLGEALTHTVTLIEDADLGMPLESLYGDEVGSMRSEGYRMAEVSCLAGNPEVVDRRQGFSIYVNLMGLMAQYGRYHGVDRLLVACHPRHSRFYEDFLGFEVFGGLKSYDTVNGNPAVGCYHDFAFLDRAGYRLQEAVYAIKHEPWTLTRRPMSPEEQAYFKPAAALAPSGFLPTAA